MIDAVMVIAVRALFMGSSLVGGWGLGIFEIGEISTDFICR